MKPGAMKLSVYKMRMKKSAYLGKNISRYSFGISTQMLCSFNYVELGVMVVMMMMMMMMMMMVMMNLMNDELNWKYLTSLRENKSLADVPFIKHGKGCVTFMAS